MVMSSMVCPSMDPRVGRTCNSLFLADYNTVVERRKGRVSRRAHVEIGELRQSRGAKMIPHGSISRVVGGLIVLLRESSCSSNNLPAFM